MIKLGTPIYVCIAATLLLRGLPVSANDMPSVAAKQLLIKLRTCLDEVNASKADALTSSCANIEVAALTGISLARMTEELGPPGLCGVNGSYECRWGFYKLPGLGGGPELQCVAEDRVTCKQIRWIQTQ
jgi:hypothetical protein